MTAPNSPLAQLADPTLLRTESLVGGEWVTAADRSARFAVHDPATGIVLAEVARLAPPEAATFDHSALMGFTSPGHPMVLSGNEIWPSAESAFKP